VTLLPKGEKRNGQNEGELGRNGRARGKSTGRKVMSRGHKSKGAAIGDEVQGGHTVGGSWVFVFKRESGHNKKEGKTNMEVT